MWSHSVAWSVACLLKQVYTPQPDRPILDLPTPEGWTAELALLIASAAEGSWREARCGEWPPEIPSELGSFPAVADAHRDGHCLRRHSKRARGSRAAAARPCADQTGNRHVCSRLRTDEGVRTESGRGTRRCSVHVPQRGWYTVCKLTAGLMWKLAR